MFSLSIADARCDTNKTHLFQEGQRTGKMIGVFLMGAISA